MSISADQRNVISKMSRDEVIAFIEDRKKKINSALKQLLGEESSTEASLLEKDKDIIAKASFTDAQRSELNAILQMSDEEAAKAEANVLAEFRSIMGKLLGEESPTDTPEKKTDQQSASPAKAFLTEQEKNTISKMTKEEREKARQKDLARLEQLMKEFLREESPTDTPEKKTDQQIAPPRKGIIHRRSKKRA